MPRHVPRIGEKRNAYKISNMKPEEINQLGDHDVGARITLTLIVMKLMAHDRD
jgi:hypothetical protein